MKIAFVHPDLGIGGAERLVVDAAVGLQNRGHDVCIYTAHHDPSHCFEETRDGTLVVLVRGDWLPRHTFGRLQVLWAMTRNIYTAICVLLSGSYDVIIVDQISISVPLLELKARVYFYCHFPDMLLTDRRSLLKSLYRLPFDFIEELTTDCATKIVVNSAFTQDIFKRTFKSIQRQPSVLHPAINLSKYDGVNSDEQMRRLGDKRIVLLSINRFERKKNLPLAIHAFHKLKDLLPQDTFERLRLVVAGGYDTRVTENVQHHQELTKICEENGILVSVYPDTRGHVVFVRSFDDQQRAALLEICRCVLYTPAHEHFGIVPVEAMYCSRAVVCVNNGGPLESVLDGETGYLRPGVPEQWADVLRDLVMDESKAVTMGKAGRVHVKSKFTLEAFAEKLEKQIVQTHSSPPQKWPFALRVMLILMFAFIGLVLALAVT